jgi:hypothetical protein
MKTGAPRFVRKSILLAAVCILAVVLTACTGRGGGQLPPNSRLGFSGSASFGFDFSCEDSGGINPQTGQLRIQLSYNDKGSNPIGSSFGIHGIVDKIDPVLESAICIGQNPPPGGNKLIFLGRYWVTSSPAPKALQPCPKGDSSTSPMCRFEVIVKDNDRNRAPSSGDSFSISLSNVPASCDATTLDEAIPCSVLPEGSVPYARSGNLSSGNLTVS